MRRLRASLLAACVTATLVAPVAAADVSISPSPRPTADSGDAAAPITGLSLPIVLDDAAAPPLGVPEAAPGGAGDPTWAPFDQGPAGPNRDEGGAKLANTGGEPTEEAAQPEPGAQVGGSGRDADGAVTGAVGNEQAAFPLSGGHPCLQPIRSSCTLSNSRYLDLGLELGAGMQVRVPVRLRQGEVRRTAMNDFRAMRRRMWNANPPFDGKPLRTALAQAGIRSANEYAERVVWDHDAERVAIQRAAEQILTGIAHERPGTGEAFGLTLKTGQYVSSENLACRPHRMSPSYGLKMWEEELPQLIKHKGAFNGETGHLYLLLDPKLRFHAFAQSEDTHYVNVSISEQASSPALAVGDGCYAVDVPIPDSGAVTLTDPGVLARNDRAQLSATTVYKSMTFAVTGTYSSSAPDVLSVDANTGVLSPRTPGTATITFTPTGSRRSFTRQVRVDAQMITRLSGADRVATAVSITQAQEPSPTALLATGRSYADALSAGGLSRLLDAPIYLTNTKGALEPQVLNTLKRRGVTKVVILGGHGAVPAAVEASLSGAGLESERIAGQNRAETSVLIAQRALAADAGRVRRVLVTDGANFPDGLAAGAISENAESITVVTNGASLPAGTEQFLRQHAQELEIVSVGGAGNRALDGAGIVPTRRVVGASRVDTAAQLARAYPSGPATLAQPSRVVIANGNNFPDALAASALTARQGGVLLLTASTKLEPLTERHLKSLPRPVSAFLVGGEKLVSKRVEQSVRLATR